MNFVADHQRAQEYLPTLYHHHDNNRQDQHYYPSPSPCPSTYSQPQSPLPPSPYSQSTSFSHTSSIRGTLPEVGQTRCYWALLSTDLRFLVLDPVLAYHLREQANDILDTSLLEFVHPEERASAKEDLGGVLRERTLHGSVTRVRFCRLSCVRRLLGYTPSEEAPPYPPTFPAERIAIDNNYMAIDIVLNWAAEGVVLCFLHAVVDIAPREDNDESLKTGWSNWCSTYGFDEEQAKGMITRLSDTILPQMHPHRGQRQDPSLRVLQILRNDQDRSLMLSWPPDDVSTRSYTTVPHAQDLGRLAQHVEIGSSGASGDARTSCTRRYKSFQKMPAMPGDGSCVEVESIFVPHGTIIFACHKIDYVRHTRDSYCSGTLYQCSGTQGMVVDYPPSAARSHPDYDLGGATYDLSYTEEELSEGQLTQSSYVAQWVEGQSSPYAYEPQQRHWSYAHAHEHTPSPNSSTHDTGTQIDSVMTGISYATYETECTKHQESAGNVVNVHARSSSSALADRDIRTPARSVRKGNSTRGAGDDVVDSPTGISKPSASREVYSGGRSSGNPPVGVSRCASCGATHSPEWRKGPSGKKDLCNACGLRYARSRAKKEGTAARKRKEKDKGPIKRISPSSLSTVANGEPITLHDEAMFDESNQLSRSSPSIVSDTPGPPQPPQSGRTHHGSSRTYNRSGEEYIKHNGFTSEEELSPSFVQGSNHQRSLLGVNAMTVSSALVPSLGNENSTGGSYGAQLEGHNYKHTSVSPTDSFDQNRLQNIHGRPSLHPSSPRISRSSPLRTTMDL